MQDSYYDQLVRFAMTNYEANNLKYLLYLDQIDLVSILPLLSILIRDVTVSDEIKCATLLHLTSRTEELPKDDVFEIVKEVISSEASSSVRLSAALVLFCYFDPENKDVFCSIDSSTVDQIEHILASASVQTISATLKRINK
jgi:hypothetical protein